MFYPNAIVIDAFVNKLKTSYFDSFGLLEPEFPSITAFVARLVLENLSNCDAPYHNMEHTILVTDVGLTLLRGKHIATGELSPHDWFHATIALLCHDIGYVRGVIQGDTETQFVINEAGETIELPRGSTDASLQHWHVDRSKLFVKKWFSDKVKINQNEIMEMIELTRFPIPDDDFYKQTDTLGGLVRAADLIGQMGDVHYLRKTAALYAEFVESGSVKELGYTSAADLRENYPTFFWKTVAPAIQHATEYLRKTHEGRLWLSTLYSHVFAEEHFLKSAGAVK
jgi:hypothetical protein